MHINYNAQKIQPMEEPGDFVFEEVDILCKKVTYGFAIYTINLAKQTCDRQLGDLELNPHQERYMDLLWADLISNKENVIVNNILDPEENGAFIETLFETAEQQQALQMIARQQLTQDDDKELQAALTFSLQSDALADGNLDESQDSGLQNAIKLSLESKLH